MDFSTAYKYFLLPKPSFLLQHHFPTSTTPAALVLSQCHSSLERLLTMSNPINSTLNDRLISLQPLWTSHSKLRSPSRTSRLSFSPNLDSTSHHGRKSANMTMMMMSQTRERPRNLSMVQSLSTTGNPLVGREVHNRSFRTRNTKPLQTTKGLSIIHAVGIVWDDSRLQ